MVRSRRSIKALLTFVVATILTWQIMTTDSMSDMVLKLSIQYLDWIEAHPTPEWPVEHPEGIAIYGWEMLTT